MKKIAYVTEIVSDEASSREIYDWRAISESGVVIAFGRSKEECVNECESKGYVVIDS